MDGTSIISVQWFWRVVIWWLIEVDIHQLSSNGIQFDQNSFKYTYSIQSSSTLSLLSSSLDAPALDNYISFGEDMPSPEDHVVKNRTELDSIPLDVQHLCLGRLDTSGITEYPFNSFQSLRSLVIGKSAFWECTRFELSNLPSLLSIVICNYSFFNAPLFSLTGLIDWFFSTHRSSSTTISQTCS